MIKYKVTPLNFCSALLIGLELLFIVFPESLKGVPNAYLSFYLIPLGLAGFTVDYFLQKYIKKYWRLFFIEIVIMLLYVVINAI